MTRALIPLGLLALIAAGLMLVAVSNHGLTKHPEALRIQESCNSNMAEVQKWKDKYEKGKYYLLCQFQDESGKLKYGIVPVILEAGKLIGKTAFSPGDGTLNSVRMYLERSATRFTGELK